VHVASYLDHASLADASVVVFPVQQHALPTNVTKSCSYDELH
jgi:hypothetical protein